MTRYHVCCAQATVAIAQFQAKPASYSRATMFSRVAPKPGRTLELHDGDGGLIAANDKGKSDQRTGIEATQIQPLNDFGSVIVADRPLGLYTAIVTGNGMSGVVLREVYNLP
jgi:hypothetical protein